MTPSEKYEKIKAEIINDQKEIDAILHKIGEDFIMILALRTLLNEKKA